MNMAMKTTYTCDRCGHEQDSDKQMWSIGVAYKCTAANLRYGSDSSFYAEALWCRACMVKFGILGSNQIEVWNMDSRAGRITERLAAGVTLDDARKLAGHNQVSTTVRYSRNTPEAIERALGPKWPEDKPPPDDGSFQWDNRD